MRAHALRHILLKALAFGVIAVMLTGVCAAQKRVWKPDTLHFLDAAKQAEDFARKYPKDNKTWLSSAGHFYFYAGEIEKGKKLFYEVLANPRTKTYNDKISKSLASYYLAEVFLSERNFEKCLAYLDSSNTKYKAPPASCSVGPSYGNVDESYFYAKAYLGLNDTLSAIRALLKNVFAAEEIERIYPNEQYFFDTRELLLDLLFKKYSAYTIKEEFINGFNNYKPINTFESQSIIKVLNTDVWVIPLVSDLNYNRSELTSIILLKQFYKTNFYRKLFNFAPAQWLFYPVALN